MKDTKGNTKINGRIIDNIFGSYVVVMGGERLCIKLQETQFERMYIHNSAVLYYRQRAIYISGALQNCNHFSLGSIIMSLQSSTL